MRSWFATLRSRGLATRLAVLVLGVLVVYALVAPVAFSLGGPVGLCAAGLAAVLCFSGAATALPIGHVLRGPKYVLQATLLGMGIRMAIPLAFGLACHLHGGAVAEAGVLYYLLAFYPVTLAIEIALSLPGGDGPDRARDVSQDVLS